MKCKPLVSIIAPCYNGEKYMDAFFLSIIEQEYSNIELIFVNDGSTDGTEKKALSYVEKLKKKGIDYKYIFQKNAGQAAAINQGLKIFSGDYLMWIDSDDILLKNHVKEKVDFLEQNKQFGFALSEGEKVDADRQYVKTGVLKRVKPIGVDSFFEDLIYERNIVFGPGTVMVRREVILSTIPERRIYESRQGQNWQLMLPIVYSNKCGYLEKVLFTCVEHSDSHSRMIRDYAQLRERQMEIEELLVNTINRIPQMSDAEKKEWCNKISIKHARNRLNLAYQYYKLHDIRNELHYLKNLGYRVTLDEICIIYYTKFVWDIIKRKIKLMFFSKGEK